MMKGLWLPSEVYNFDRPLFSYVVHSRAHTGRADLIQLVRSGS